MSRFFVDDDIFSPVRFDDLSDDSEGESNDSEENGPINIDTAFLSTHVEKNKKTVESNKTLTKRESGRFKLKNQHIAHINPKSANTSAASNRSSSEYLNKERKTSDFAKVKAEKQKNVSKRNSETQKHDLLSKRNNQDWDPPIPNSPEEINVKRRSRQKSLLVSKNDFGNSLVKDVKKGQQNIIQSSDRILCPDELEKSNLKLPEKKLIDSSLHSSTTSEMSEKQKMKFSADESMNKKSSHSCEVSQNLKLTCNPSCLPYEASIEKMVHQSISSETAKIRQNMYMQQMCFYRQLNQVKDEMKQEHLATTEYLFRIIEELMEVNASLKLALKNKN